MLVSFMCNNWYTFSRDKYCTVDKCLVPGTLHYRRSGGCNCFYKCVDGISVPSCCPKGYRYDDDNECVAAVGAQICDDECETLSILNRELAQTCTYQL